MKLAEQGEERNNKLTKKIQIVKKAMNENKAGMEDWNLEQTWPQS